MKLSMMTIMLGHSVSIPEIAKTAVACRMNAIDWDISGDLHEAKEKRKYSEENGLKVIACTASAECFMTGNNNYKDEFKRYLEAAIVLGAPMIMIPPFSIINQKSLAEDRKKWTAYYAEMFPLAKSADITLTLESTGLIDSPIVSSSEVLEVLDAVPGLKLVFDIGNTYTADDPISAFSILKGYIVHVHIKDYLVTDTPIFSGSRFRRNGKYCTNVIVGHGNIGIEKICDFIDQSGYDKYGNLETNDPRGIIPADIVMKSVSGYLRKR